MCARQPHDASGIARVRSPYSRTRSNLYCTGIQRVVPHLHCAFLHPSGSLPFLSPLATLDRHLALSPTYSLLQQHSQQCRDGHGHAAKGSVGAMQSRMNLLLSSEGSGQGLVIQGGRSPAGGKGCGRVAAAIRVRALEQSTFPRSARGARGKKPSRWGVCRERRWSVKQRGWPRCRDVVSAPTQLLRRGLFSRPCQSLLLRTPGLQTARPPAPAARKGGSPKGPLLPPAGPAPPQTASCVR